MSKFWSLETFAELSITISLGLVLYFPLQKKDLGEISWLVGALLLLNRIVLFSNIKNTLSPLDKIKEQIDLGTSCNIDKINQLIKLYTSNTAQEFHEIKNNIITESISKLHQINNEKKSDLLPSGEYYSWLLSKLDSLKKGDCVTAISTMNQLEWDESPTEKKFFESNISAAKRGVAIERIFIMDKSILEEALNNKMINAHTKETTPNLNGYFIDKQYLIKQDPELLKKAGDGNIQFNDQVVLIDLFKEDGEARGVVSMEPGELNNRSNIFRQLKVHSSSLEKSLVED